MSPTAAARSKPKSERPAEEEGQSQHTFTTTHARRGMEESEPGVYIANCPSSNSNIRPVGGRCALLLRQVMGTNLPETAVQGVERLAACDDSSPWT